MKRPERDSLATMALMALAHAEWAAADLWDVLSAPSLPGEPTPMHTRPGPGYGRTLAIWKHEYQKRSQERSERLASRLRYQRTISRLVHDGLVERVGFGRGARFRLSARGAEERVRRAQRPVIPNPHTYTSTPSNRMLVTIVSYDIPERHRWKRVWVHSALITLGYRTVHKSVLLGTAKLPERFLKDARELGILHFMEIFEVTKSGTLRTIHG